MAEPTMKSSQYIIQFYRDGVEVLIDTVTSAAVNQDSEFTRSQFVGNPIPEGDQVFNGYSGSFDFEVRNSAADDLMEAITSQNYIGAGISDISLLETETYSNQETAVFLHQDVQLRLSKNAQGNSKVTKRLDFQSSFKKKL